MAKTFTSLHFHLVFSTRNRAPFLSEEQGGRMHEYLGGCLRELRSNSTGNRWCCGSRTPAHGPEAHPSSLRCSSSNEERILRVDQGQDREFPLAGRLLSVHGESFSARTRPDLHSAAGGASQEEDIRRGVPRSSSRPWDRFRRALPALIVRFDSPHRLRGATSNTFLSVGSASARATHGYPLRTAKRGTRHRGGGAAYGGRNRRGRWLGRATVSRRPPRSGEGPGSSL